jgi:hypothetical protein
MDSRDVQTACSCKASDDAIWLFPRSRGPWCDGRPARSDQPFPRSAVRTAVRFGCYQSPMMMGHLCGSQSQPVALGTARRWMALDAARWWMEDPWRWPPSLQMISSMLRCRLFCSTMQTLGPRTVSIGGPWLAASQSRNADSMMNVFVYPTCCQPEAWRGLSLLMIPYVFLAYDPYDSL